MKFSIILFSLLTVSAARYVSDLKAGTYGYLVDGEIVKTWTPDEFDEWRNTNPLVELLMVVGYPYLKPTTTGGSTSAGISPLGQSGLSQASTSVGNGGSFASAGVRPVVPVAPGAIVGGVLSTVSAQETTDVPVSTEVVTSLPVDPSPPDASPTAEQPFGPAPSSPPAEAEKQEISENEIDVGVSSASLSTDRPDNKDRPTNSRPGFSSATSAAQASSEVHAEGSSLAESPSSNPKGNSESNSNSASVVYGEFAGSVSISSSSSSG